MSLKEKHSLKNAFERKENWEKKYALHFILALVN